MNKPLCAAPFIGMFWRGNSSIDDTFYGQYRPCCESRTPIVESQWESSNLKIENESNFDKIFNNDYAKDVRSKLIEGKFHEICWHCEYKEKEGFANQRDAYNRVATLVEKLYGPINWDVEKGNLDEKIYWLDYRGSNLCNLQCRMCSPYNSSAIASEAENLDINEREIFEKNVHFKLETSNIYDKKKEGDTFYKKIPLKDVIYMKLLGGEPLIMKEVFSMIDAIKGNENLRLMITTNLTNISNKFLSKFFLNAI